ncbi:hypothetical protein D3C86_2072050 [compost metagenome]
MEGVVHRLQDLEDGKLKGLAFIDLLLTGLTLLLGLGEIHESRLVPKAGNPFGAGLEV